MQLVEENRRLKQQVRLRDLLRIFSPFLSHTLNFELSFYLAGDEFISRPKAFARTRQVIRFSGDQYQEHELSCSLSGLWQPLRVSYTRVGLSHSFSCKYFLFSFTSSYNHHIWAPSNKSYLISFFLAVSRLIQTHYNYINPNNFELIMT